MTSPNPGLTPRNLAAQLSYRGRGNPPVTHPTSAISNCFPGLEFDIRAIWRRFLVGIVMSENNNYVVASEDPKFDDLVGHRLLKINDRGVSVAAKGPVNPSRESTALATKDSPKGVAFMEWSNTVALLFRHQGKTVTCVFTDAPEKDEQLPDDPKVKTRTLEMKLRRIFEQVEIDGAMQNLPVLAEVLAQPGELSQGLCSPWQNDYRECACYYWAASRPDYVNVVAADDGTSRGDNWMQKENTGSYIPDNRNGEENFDYDALFTSWERVLRFVVEGIQEKSPEDPIEP